MTDQESLARERAFWERQGWDHAIIGIDPAGPNPDVQYVMIFDAAKKVLWQGTHTEFVKMADRMKAVEGQRYLDAARGVAGR